MVCLESGRDGEVKHQALRLTFGSQSTFFFEIVNKQLGNNLRCSFMTLALFQLTEGTEKQVLANYFAVIVMLQCITLKIF